MAQTTLLSLLSGPAKKTLYYAAANFEQGVTVDFVVQPTGTDKSFQLDVQPAVLGRSLEKPSVVNLELLTEVSNIRLVGCYDFATRTGELDCPPENNDPLVAWLGLNSRFEATLMELGFTAVSNFKDVTEVALCHKLLLHKAHGMPLTNGWISMVVDNFLRLRDRLDALGFTNQFQGDRQTVTQLFTSF
ncbi:MAG TPA: hypothetical protein VFO38_00620 [Candidatus Saccharimonadales bacterium]|nr:hypothetical protein [Candidatus Saccharimonadales bacterium]